MSTPKLREWGGAAALRRRRAAAARGEARGEVLTAPEAPGPLGHRLLGFWRRRHPEGKRGLEAAWGRQGSRSFLETAADVSTALSLD